MTKEQAIEIIEKIKRGIMIDAKAPNINIRNIATLKVEAIETVLKMLKEKDKEIEFQKDINKIEKDRHKKTEKSLKGQLEKKDKIMDKMVEEINETDRGYNDYCQFKIVCDRKCEDCIKQYYAGLAEKE